MCSFRHDSAKVAVCKQWLLTGSCSDAKCSLQHRHCPDLMPLCSFFLQASCAGTGPHILLLWVPGSQLRPTAPYALG